MGEERERKREGGRGGEGEDDIGGGAGRWSNRRILEKGSLPKAANFIVSPLVATERAEDSIYQENILYLTDSVQGLGEFILAPKDVSYFKQQIKSDISK